MSKQQVRARLLDALLSDIVLPPLPNTDVALDEREMFTHNAALRQVLGGATCIEATNVARFFDDSYLADGTFDSFWTDLKCLVPPYKRFFVEWEKPLIPNAKRMGMLFLACPPELAEATARMIIGEGARSTPAKIAEFRQDPRCRWIYLTLDFLEFTRKPSDGHVSALRGPFHIGTISVAEDGSLLNFWMSHASANIPKDESMQVAAASLVAWTTVSMLNCANHDDRARGPDRVPEGTRQGRQEAARLVPHGERRSRQDTETDRGESARRRIDAEAPQEARTHQGLPQGRRPVRTLQGRVVLGASPSRIGGEGRRHIGLRSAVIATHEQ